MSTTCTACTATSASASMLRTFIPPSPLGPAVLSASIASRNCFFSSRFAKPERPSVSLRRSTSPEAFSAARNVAPVAGIAHQEIELVVEVAARDAIAGARGPGTAGRRPRAVQDCPRAVGDRRCVQVHQVLVDADDLGHHDQLAERGRRVVTAGEIPRVAGVNHMHAVRAAGERRDHNRGRAAAVEHDRRAESAPSMTNCTLRRCQAREMRPRWHAAAFHSHSRRGPATVTQGRGPTRPPQRRPG